jgi:hypothetical protein
MRAGILERAQPANWSKIQSRFANIPFFIINVEKPQFISGKVSHPLQR